MKKELLKVFSKKKKIMMNDWGLIALMLEKNVFD